jgi:hypothetical protein
LKKKRIQIPLRLADKAQKEKAPVRREFADQTPLSETGTGKHAMRMWQAAFGLDLAQTVSCFHPWRIIFALQ